MNRKDILNWIECVRKESIPPIRIEKRKEYEQKARKFLYRKRGHFNENDLKDFFKLANYDITDRDKRLRIRFRPSFSGMNCNRMISSGMKQINFWFNYMLKDEKSVSDRLNKFLKDNQGNGTGSSTPTLLLYLNNNSKYNIWLPLLHDGIELLSGKNFERGRSAKNYLKYNRAVNKFKLKYFIEPQEIDIILAVSGKRTEKEIIEETNDFLKIERKRKKHKKTIQNGLKKINIKGLTEDIGILDNISDNLNPIKVKRIIETIKRNQKEIKILKKKFKGRCQICNKTFSKEDGTPYSEVHHVIPLGEKGSDSVDNMVVLCPEHHRKLHYAKTGRIGKKRKNKRLVKINNKIRYIKYHD